jgi:hypothetical protein
MRSTLARTPEERLALALSWNRMAGRLSAAGRRALLADVAALTEPERREAS